MRISSAMVQCPVKIVAVRIERSIFMLNGIAQVAEINRLIHAAYRVRIFLRFFYFSQDGCHAPVGEELCKSFVHAGAVCFVVSHHPEKPVMAYFMRKQSV